VDEHYQPTGTMKLYVDDKVAAESSVRTLPSSS
jgi:hypothetical protein